MIPDDIDTTDGKASKPSKKPIPEAWYAAAALWGQQALPAQGRKPSAGPELRSKLGQRLLTAVRKDPDAVLDAIRFAAESSHARAQFLRESRYNLETVLRHVDEYAALWRELGAAPQPTATRPPRAGEWSGGDGILDKLFRELNGREVIDVE